MANVVIDKINSINDGEEITLSIPFGGNYIDITGTASYDANGNVVVKADPFSTGSLYIENGTLTIERNNGSFSSDDISISINGDGKYGDVSESVNDLRIRIKDDKVFISNSPQGLNDGAYEIQNDFHFSLTEGKKSGVYGIGSSVSLASKASLTNKPENTFTSSFAGAGVNTLKTETQKNPNSVSSKLTSVYEKFVGQATGQTEVQGKDITQFVTRNHDEYWNSDFQKIIDNTSDVNYDTLSQQLQSDVNFLENNFSKVKDQITKWQGTASAACRSALDSITNKFDCTLSNITNKLGPACTKLETFKEDLEKLKKGKEELTGADGNGGLDKELKDLTQDYEDKQSDYNELKNNEPPTQRWQANDDGGSYVHNAAHDSWEASLASALAAMNTAKEKVDEKQNEIKAKELELDELFNTIKETYSMIQELVGSIDSFKNYLGSSASSSMLSSMDEFLKNFGEINDLDLESNIDPSQTSKPVLADSKFFENACREHASEGWKIENGVVTMVIDGKQCTYDINRHKFSNGDRFNNNGRQQKVELEAYFYLPSHIVNSNDYSQLSNLNTYTFFSSNQKQYVNTIKNKEINTVTIEVIKQDPLTQKYGAVSSLTKMANNAANTNLNKCQNIIGGDSVYGAHSLKIAASTGNLYNTVYCVDNAAIVTGYNGKAGTKEQFSSIEDLKGLDGKNIYFINTCGDDNYSMGADMSVARGRAYVSVGSRNNISVEQVKNSFTYTGIELVAKNCPNSKIHIVYQDQDTNKAYQRTNFPIALNQLAGKYSNVWNDSSSWDRFADKKYKTHSEGNYIPHDLADAATTMSGKNT